MRPPNNFAALRLFGALWVILHHGMILTGHPRGAPSLLGTVSFGIVIFFTAAGYLLTSSWLSTPNYRLYTINRIKRIFPALIFVVTFTVFVLGPLVSTLTVSEYFDNPRTWRYFLNLLLRPVFTLPGVFEDNPDRATVNGSLWTTPPLVIAYLILPILLYLFRGKWKAVPVAMFGLLSAAVHLHLRDQGETIVYWGSSLAPNTSMWVYFAVGALVRLLVPTRFLRLDSAIACAVLYMVASQIFPEIAVQLRWILAPIVILSFGLASTPYIRRADRFGDFSYGLFLWGFPVQQTVLHFLYPLPLWVNFSLVITISGVLAIATYRLVEKPSARVIDVFSRSITMTSSRNGPTQLVSSGKAKAVGNP